jgi:uncharacterized protein
MPIATAHIAIATPSRYMNRLAKHFEHRVAVTRNETSATVSFPDAPCSMQSTDSHLDIRIEAPAADQLVRLQEVVERHLRQVAASESFEVAWQQD